MARPPVLARGLAPRRPGPVAALALLALAAEARSQEPEPEPAARPALRARLLDPDGRPLGALWVTAYVAPYTGAPPFHDAQTFPVRAGEVRLEPPSGELPEPGWWVLGVWDGEHCRLHAEVPLPPAGATGELELDALPMAVPPLIVSGVVLDEAGAPLEDATVQLDSSGWLPPSVRSGPNGEFAFHGWTRGPVTVRLVHPWLPAPERTVGVGAPDVVLQPVPADVRGRLLLPQALSERDVDLVLRRRGSGGASTSFIEQAQGSFRIWLDYDFRGHAIEPSADLSTRIEVRARGLYSVVWSRDYEPGEPVPGELEIDLRSLRSLELEVVDAGGEPVRGADLTVLGERERVLGSLKVDDRGLARLVLREPGPVRLQVVARGFLDGRLELADFGGAAQRARVVLERALEVRVTALGAPRLDPARWRLSVYAVSEASAKGGFCSAALDQPDGGPLELDLTLPAEGSWSLRWWLHHRPAPGAPWSDHLIQAPPEPFEVSAARRAYELHAPRAELEAAVARLGG